MNLEQIRDLAEKTMGTRRAHPYREPGFIFYHGQRVGSLALQLRELIYSDQKGYDQTILVGGWFHDVGKGTEPHWEHGAKMTQEILADYCSAEELTRIVEIVRWHTLRKERPYPWYVQLVQDADILDHFGTVEIWLNFLYSAHTGGSVADSLEFYEKEYGPIIKKVRGLLNYPQSVELLAEKDRFVRAFVERLKIEGAGKLV